MNEKMQDIAERTTVDLRAPMYVFENALLLMRAIGVNLSEAGEKHKGDHLYQATHILFARSLILLLSAYRSALTGLYGTASTLMRMILENAFLMRYFAAKPEEARNWVRDPNWYINKTPSRIRKLVFTGKVLRDYNRAYSRLSCYVHPSVEGWTELLVPRGQNMVFIRYDPDYDRSLATDTITFLLFLIKATMKPILMSFKPEIDESRLNELSEIQDQIDAFLPTGTIS